MTEAPKKPRPRIKGGRVQGRVPSASIRPIEALELYIEMPAEATLKELHQVIVGKGHDISLGWVTKWAKKQEWIATKKAKKMAETVLAPTEHIVKLLKAEADQFGPEVVVGLESRLIVRLARAIDEAQVTNPDDVFRLIQAYRELQAIHHALTGDVFRTRGQDEGQVPAPATTNGTGNGHANGHDDANGAVLSFGRFERK